ERETFTPDQNLVILLDLSQSMDVKDVKPSRLVRARQKIEDITKLAQGLKISLIAFAADPHMMTPLTDDMETIRHLLPSLETDLVFIQGSKLSPALTMALRMLDVASGHNKSVLILSDGGFEDAEAIATAHALAQKGIIIYTMGIGTEEGAPLQDGEGNFIKKQEKVIISKLETAKLREIGTAGNGLYLEANYSDEPLHIMLNQIKERAKIEESTRQLTRQWEDRFYLLIFPMMAILLFWFRRGFVFSIATLLVCLQTQQVSAVELQEYFKNNSELGKEALDQGDYPTALQKFTDSYQLGVTHYKAGNFLEAERFFRESTRPEIANKAIYNLGNTLAKQLKLEEAVVAYEKVLKENPDHADAKHNLEIVKKLLEQQKKQNNQQEQNDPQDKDKDQNNQSKHSSELKDQQNQRDQNEDHAQDPQKQTDQGKENSDKASEQQQESKQQPEENDTNRQETPSQQTEDTKEKPADERESKEHSETAPPETESADSHNTPESKTTRTPQDQEADQWLNRMVSDPKSFLKNKFYIESQQNGTKEVIQPW
ncbi:MAG: VWA domain-containing protein, partial [Alphaproteobacteria bacterium]|nr:VWA domain-containing protein [Alphaproteobacteria bacterium]